ncbi:MAG: hypothetical protein JW894_04385, partial [Bacteroidales bacterium]|nr:hypothetical protein [Bacteroidales bacterium]
MNGNSKQTLKSESRWQNLARSQCWSVLFMVILFFGTTTGDLLAQKGPFKPRYTRYEAENVSAQTDKASFVRATKEDALKRSTSTDKASLISELVFQATNRQYTTLTSRGSYVQWTVTTPGDGVTMRFTIPDGGKRSVNIYVNGFKDQTVQLTSHWTHVKIDGEDLIKFDEVRFRLSRSLKRGDVIRISNNSDLPVAIDFIE